MRIEKRCPMCGHIKKAEEFPRNRSSWDGLAAYCKPCHNLKMKKIAERLYGGHANFLMMKRYGITIDQKQEMIEAQNGLCLICQERPAKHVDHCHSSGQIRGILCFTCNRGLGKFEDDPELLEMAIEYLNRTSL